MWSWGHRFDEINTVHFKIPIFYLGEHCQKRGCSTGLRALRVFLKDLWATERITRIQVAGSRAHEVINKSMIAAFSRVSVFHCLFPSVLSASLSLCIHAGLWLMRSQVLRWRRHAYSRRQINTLMSTPDVRMRNTLTVYVTWGSLGCGLRLLNTKSD